MKRAAMGLLLLCLLCLPGSVQAEEELTVEQQTAQLLEGLDLEKLEELYAEGEALFGGAPLQEVLTGLCNGEWTWSAAEVLELLGDTFLNSLRAQAQLPGYLLAVVLLGGVFRHLRSSSGQSGAAMAEWAAYLLCCVLAAWMLASGVSHVRQSTDALRGGVEALSPVLTVLLTAMGSIQASAVLSPLVTAMTGGMFYMIEGVVIPLILCKSILDLGTGTSGLLRLEGFSKTLHSGVKWLLGILFVVFLGVTALKGTTGAAIDGVYFKSAKFTIDKAVPVIGGMFSDTLETLMACGVLVKNAVGVVGMLCVAAMLAAPVMRLVTGLLLLRLTAAAAGLFGETGIQKMLDKMAESMTLLQAALLSMAAMAFIVLGVVMGAADAGLMLRS